MPEESGGEERVRPSGPQGERVRTSARTSAPAPCARRPAAAANISGVTSTADDRRARVPARAQRRDRPAGATPEVDDDAAGRARSSAAAAAYRGPSSWKCASHPPARGRRRTRGSARGAPPPLPASRMLCRRDSQSPGRVERGRSPIVCNLDVTSQLCYKRSVQVCEALADETRVRIVELLAGRDLSAGELAAHFTVSRPAVSAPPPRAARGGAHDGVARDAAAARVPAEPGTAARARTVDRREPTVLGAAASTHLGAHLDEIARAAYAPHGIGGRGGDDDRRPRDLRRCADLTVRARLPASDRARVGGRDERGASSTSGSRRRAV